MKTAPGSTGSVLTGVFWSYAEQVSSQIVSLVVTIILARILEPSDYGVIAIVTVFITLLNVFVENGLSVSLIQKQNLKEVDYSTVFYVNVLCAVALYLLLWFVTPLIAHFYDMPTLTLIIRILGIRILISGVSSTFGAIIIKTMDFRKLFLASMLSITVSGSIGILLATSGFGIWSLVWQSLAYALVNASVLLVVTKWWPKRLFSLKAARAHFSYSWKISVTELITSLFVNLRSILIGKLYSTSDLAFYNQGQKVPDLIVSQAGASISRVLFPAIAQRSNNPAAIKLLMKRSIRMSAYILFPMLVGLFVLAEPLISVLLTNKWLESVPYMKIICIIYLFMPLNSANLQAIKAIGRSDVFLKIDILKKVSSIIILLASLQYGVLVIALSAIVDNVFTTALNAYPVGKLLQYGLYEQSRDVLPSLVISLVMGFLVWIIGLIIKMPLHLSLLIQVAVGVCAYLLLSFLLKVGEYYILRDYISQAYLRFKIRRSK